MYPFIFSGNYCNINGIILAGIQFSMTLMLQMYPIIFKLLQVHRGTFFKSCFTGVGLIKLSGQLLKIGKNFSTVFANLHFLDDLQHTEFSEVEYIDFYHFRSVVEFIIKIQCYIFLKS